MIRHRVFVYAEDPLTQAGIASLLRTRAEVLVVGDGEIDTAAVALVAADEVTVDVVRVVRAIQRNGCPRVVIVVRHLDDAGVLAGVEAGACGFVRRADAEPDHLVSIIRAAAAGEGAMPNDVLGRLLTQLSQLHERSLAPNGMTLAGLTAREIDVLRLLADGYDTAEIAGALAYSERTVKAVIHDLTTRLQLRNRSHAVAYAVLKGLI